MNFFNKKILYLIFFTNYFYSYSQNPIGIPMGTWRTHYDYSNVKIISYFNNKVFGSSSKGFYYYDFEDNSVNKLSNIDGLSSSGISSMYSNSTSLILGYKNGFLDIIYEDGKIKNLDLFPVLNNYEISKTVNDIFLYNNLIYVSTNQGLVVIDFLTLEILEFYSNIGNDGTQISSLETKILQDSIFVLFENGILKSKINNQINLKDYNSWNEVSFSDSLILGSLILDNNLYIYNNNKILKYNGKSFNLFKSFSNYKVKKIKNYNNEFFIITDNSILLLNKNKVISIAYENDNLFLNDAIFLENNIWVGVNDEGIINLENNQSFKIKSSIRDDASNLVSLNDKIIGLRFLQESKNSDLGSFSLFENNEWDNIKLDFFSNISSASKNNSNNIFLSSFGKGIYDLKNQKVINELSIGSTLEKVENTDSLLVTDLEFDSDDNLFISNYGVKSSLHKLDSNGVWNKFTFSNLKYFYPIDINIGKNGFIWSRLDLEFGGGILVFDSNKNKSSWINKNQNNLPSNDILSLNIDKDDKVWIGTSKGLVYYNTSIISDYNQKANDLVIDGYRFLENEKIYSIAIDESNRKWIASDNGIWVLNKNNSSLEFNFSTENSPIPSNKILDIVINNLSGEVFILSENGMVSYLTDASQASQDYSSIKIFPNPISLKENQLLSFQNLLNNSIIKIMTLSGKVISNFKSNGGGASWNLLDMNNNLVSPGIYLVYLSDDIGNDSFIQQILITN
tara:strand:+ start:562 stop:2769 length:2208 start_codon:yes stop_codon:yes gene_type:complete